MVLCGEREREREREKKVRKEKKGKNPKRNALNFNVIDVANHFWWLTVRRHTADLIVHKETSMIHIIYKRNHHKKQKK